VEDHVDKWECSGHTFHSDSLLFLLPVHVSNIQCCSFFFFFSPQQLLQNAVSEAVTQRGNSDLWEGKIPPPAPPCSAPTNTHLTKDPHKRPSAETLTKDPHKRPSAETLTKDPHKRPSPETLCTCSSSITSLSRLPRWIFSHFAFDEQLKDQKRFSSSSFF